MTGDVDAPNTAVASASCTECKTVAAAMQVVLVSGDVDSARLQDLKKRFHDLKQRVDLALVQVAQEIGRIAAEVALVVETETEVKTATEATPTLSSTSTTSPATTTTSAARPSSTTTSTPTTTVAPSSTTTSPPTTLVNTTTSAP